MAAAGYVGWKKKFPVRYITKKTDLWIAELTKSTNSTALWKIHL